LVNITNSIIKYYYKKCFKTEKKRNAFQKFCALFQMLFFETLCVVDEKCLLYMCGWLLDMASVTDVRGVTLMSRMVL
jgi:hypothetical protein